MRFIDRNTAIGWPCRQRRLTSKLLRDEVTCIATIITVYLSHSFQGPVITPGPSCARQNVSRQEVLVGVIPLR